MKGWLVGLAISAVLSAAAAGMWITWESTDASGSNLNETAAAYGMVTTTDPGPVTTTTAPPPPACDATPVVQVDPGDDWATTVVDTRTRLPEDYVPPDLVDATVAGFDSPAQVRALLVDDLSAMRAAAEANGTPLALVSGYRSFSYQGSLFERQVAETGEVAAALDTARPGHSEHQLGTAIDVLEPGVTDLTAEFATRPTGQWVAARAHEFGFVLSYPQGATEVTCYAFEPWHLRYVGRDIAATIVDSGMAPREWFHAHRDGAD